MARVVAFFKSEVTNLHTYPDLPRFDDERAELLKNASVLDTYAQKMLKMHISLLSSLVKASLNSVSERFVVRFSSFLLMNKDYDIVAFAKQQYPVLISFEHKTASIPAFIKYHNYYKEASEDLAWFAQRH